MLHGVPFNLNYDNNYRYALNIRHPNFKDKIELNNKNCNLNEIMKNSLDWNCVNNIHLELLKIFSVAFFWFDLNLMIPYTLLIAAAYYIYIKYNVQIAKYIYYSSYVLVFLIVIINHLTTL